MTDSHPPTTNETLSAVGTIFYAAYAAGWQAAGGSVDSRTQEAFRKWVGRLLNGG